MLSEANFEYLREVLRKESGFAMGRDHQYLVKARLLPLVRDQGLRSLDELLDGVRAGRLPGLLGEIAERMTVNETLFFRDTSTFEALSKRWLPELIAGSPGRTLSVWSAASSTGQEAYSVAMAAQDLGARVSVLGTDLCQDALRRANAGRYSRMEVKRGLTDEMLAKYFTAVSADEYLASRELRSAVRFELLNLIGPWRSMPKMDLILLRNVLIYFNDETKRYVLRRARDLLAPKGLLLLGASEPTTLAEDLLERIPAPGQSVFRVRRAG